MTWLRNSPSGQSSPEARVEALADVISWTVFGAGIDWSGSEEPRSLDSYVEEIVAILLRSASDMFRQ